MKNVFLIFTILIALNISAQESSHNKASVYYFIRHAEKDRSNPSNKNPHLNEDGKKRAEHWSKVFSNIKFDQIYSTDYNRTKETARPTATNNTLDLTIYNPKELNINTFLKENQGKTVLIVGHSNTTPTLVNTILGTKKYPMIADNNNANLYIVIVYGTSVSDQLLVID